MQALKLRLAAPDDAKRIADLHAESWRRHYRGAYRDSYLDGDIFSERLALWSERLARPDRAFTIVAVDGDALLGFAHTIPDHDPVYGALLDNLHVTAHRMRRGVGSVLMRETAAHLEQRTNTVAGLYLWVLEQNRNAQAFYAARGGVAAGREIAGPFPGGGTAPALRVHWPDPSASLRV